MKIILVAISVPILLGSAMYVAPNSPFLASSPMPLVEPTDTEVLQGVLLCGIGPESLALAGCSQTDAAAIVGAIRASESLPDLFDARGELESAAAQVSTLVEQVYQDPFKEELRSALATAKAAQRTAAAAFATARDELLGDALEVVDSEEATAIRACRAAAGRKVPPEFRVADCSQTDWRRVEKALIAERRAERLNEELDQEHAQVLSEIRSRSEVTAARARLAQSDLESLQGVFEGLRAD